MIKKNDTQLKGKKKAMMEALITSMGNITTSAKKASICRLTHYDWLEKDEVYRQEYESLDDMECDFYRTALHQLVKEKNVTAVIFGLKTKGKHRGYVERQEIATSIKSDLDANSLNAIWEEIKDSENDDK